jgi:hypothetical protein
MQLVGLEELGLLGDALEQERHQRHLAFRGQLG